MRNYSISYVTVGVFVTAMIVALIVTLTLIAGRTGPRDEYRVLFDNVTDLKYGTVVRYEGFPIGTVDKIVPVYENGKYRFGVMISVQKDWKFPADSKAGIRASSFLAAKTIDIGGGKSADLIAVGGDIPGTGAGDMFALMSGLAGRVGALLDTGVVPLIEQLKTSIKQLTETANSQIGGVGGDVRGLVANASAHLDTISASVTELTAGMQTNVDQLHKILSDGNVKAIDQILANLDRASLNADKTLAELNALSIEVNGVAQSIQAMVNRNAKNVDKSTADLEYILRAVSQNIDAITNNLEGTTRNMNEFSRLIRQNPGLLLGGGSPAADKGLTPVPGGQ
ncbi:MlaD family protein [Dongia sedimenti]|uniref:MlaD family protein n=1 Tax=Dongia sedimenti TaxID=3064282 RepID=A0ABU0YQB9_9PROT|nr:MlaD family protein [Rhodospirillaceae bacterium R-7]